MALVNVHNHYHGGDAELINQKLDKMNEDLKLVQEQLTAAETKADTILTNLEGVQTDVNTLKQQIADLEAAGVPAEQIAALKATAASLSGKVDTIGTKSADLDAQTP
jgi:uncharacterized protein (DUF3084 family)